MNSISRKHFTIYKLLDMKTLFTVAILCTAFSSLKSQESYGIMHIGYPIKYKNPEPIFSFDLGHVFFDSTHWLRPFIEIGEHVATDQQSNSNIYGHLSAGIQLLTACRHLQVVFMVETR